MSCIKETTHIVIKIDDTDKYLSEHQKRELNNILLTINKGRLSDKKPLNEYLVINKDEKYADKIQKLILCEESEE